MSATDVSAIAAVASAITSVVAVFIAARSASSAKRSAETAAQVLQRSALRDLVTLCQDAIAEKGRIESLCIDLGAEYTFMFNAPGIWEGSAHKQATESLSQDRTKAANLANESQGLVDNPSRLITASTVDIDQSAARIGVARGELRTIRESIERHLIDTRARNAERREKVI